MTSRPRLHDHGIARITVNSSARTRRYYRLSLPPHIGDTLEPLNLLYSAELTDDGILFRPIPGSGSASNGATPEWAKP